MSCDQSCLLMPTLGWHHGTLYVCRAQAMMSRGWKKICHCWFHFLFLMSVVIEYSCSPVVFFIKIYQNKVYNLYEKSLDHPSSGWIYTGARMSSEIASHLNFSIQNSLFAPHLSSERVLPHSYSLGVKASYKKNPCAIQQQLWYREAKYYQDFTSQHIFTSQSRIVAMIKNRSLALLALNQSSCSYSVSSAVHKGKG